MALDDTALARFRLPAHRQHYYGGGTGCIIIGTVINRIIFIMRYSFSRRANTKVIIMSRKNYIFIRFAFAGQNTHHII